jgi:hypothetical protein
MAREKREVNRLSFKRVSQAKGQAGIFKIVRLGSNVKPENSV